MSYLKNRFNIFRNKAFRYYVISCTFAMFGNGLTYITLSWLLAKGSHNVAAISGLMCAFWLPNIILGPIMGVISDRFNKKHIIFICNGLRMLLLTLFFFVLLVHPQSFMAVYLLAFISGTILSLYFPTAIAFVREIVPENELLNANATSNMAYELGALLGMSSSGLFIALFNEQTTLLINALCYFLALGFIYLIPFKDTKEKKVTKTLSYWADIKAGFNYLTSKPNTLILYAVQMIVFSCYMTAPVLLVPFSKDILHASAGQFGLIEGALSLGVFLGGIITPYIADKYGYRRIVCFELIMGAISFAIFSLNHSLYWAFFLYAIVGFSFSVWPLVTTIAQQKTELSYQGRVQSLFNSVSGIVILVFYLNLSLLGELMTIDKLYWFEIGLFLCGAYVILKNTIKISAFNA